MKLKSKQKIIFNQARHKILKRYKFNKKENLNKEINKEINEAES